MREGRIATSLQHDGWVRVKLAAKKEANPPACSWFEYWQQGDLKYVVSDRQPLELSSLSHAFDGEHLFFSGRHVQGLQYQLTGVIETSSSERKVEAVMEENGQLLGSVWIESEAATFQGELSHLQARRGRMTKFGGKTILEGCFENNQLTGEGIQVHVKDVSDTQPSSREVLRITGQFKHNLKEGVAVVELNEARILVGEYCEDIKHGYATRFYSSSKQLMYFNEGDLRVACEEEPL